MTDRSKGGSPTEKHPMKQIPSVVPMRTVPEGALPQMMGFAAYAMIERMRMEEQRRIKWGNRASLPHK